MSIETILPMDGLLNPGQHRLASVQLVNWGTFDGAHTIRVDRAGTLLTGGSGVGKSTIFDGMLQVLDARPKMNKAAQTNSGQASEERRTAFSYMRGRLGAAPAAGDESRTATFYQRPGAIWSAVCLTFDNALGQTTSLAVMLDLPANGTEHNVAALPPAQQAAGHPPAGVGHGGPLQQDIVGDAAAGQQVYRLAQGVRGTFPGRHWASTRRKPSDCCARCRPARGWAAPSTISSATTCWIRRGRWPRPKRLCRTSATCAASGGSWNASGSSGTCWLPCPGCTNSCRKRSRSWTAPSSWPTSHSRSTGAVWHWNAQDRQIQRLDTEAATAAQELGSDRGCTRRAQAADGAADRTVRQRGRRRRRHLGAGTGRSPVRAAGPPIGRGFFPSRSGGRGP